MMTKTGLAVAAVLTLFRADTAEAKSVALSPGSIRTVPSTNAATPALTVRLNLYYAAAPFKIRNAAGAVVCAGYLENIVIKLVSGQLYFYRITVTTNGDNEPMYTARSWLSVW
jgi:hypothetical protein